jgi:hypothetical protein
MASYARLSTACINTSCWCTPSLEGVILTCQLAQGDKCLLKNSELRRGNVIETSGVHGRVDRHCPAAGGARCWRNRTMGRSRSQRIGYVANTKLCRLSYTYVASLM